MIPSISTLIVMGNLEMRLPLTSPIQHMAGIRMQTACGIKVQDCCGGFQMEFMGCHMVMFTRQEADIRTVLQVLVNWYY